MYILRNMELSAVVKVFFHLYYPIVFCMTSMSLLCLNPFVFRKASRTVLFSECQYVQQGHALQYTSVRADLLTGWKNFTTRTHDTRIMCLFTTANGRSTVAPVFPVSKAALVSISNYPRTRLHIWITSRSIFEVDIKHESLPARLISETHTCNYATNRPNF